MTRFLLLFLLLVPSARAQDFVFGTDTEFVMQIVGADDALPETGITQGNFTGTLEQPSQHGGAQIVSNGTFADATGWTLGGTWAVGSGTLNAVNETGTTACIVLGHTEGIAYEVIYTITSYTDGTITVDIGGTSGTARSSAATFTETIIAGGGANLCFTGATAATASIDNLTVYQTAVEFTPSATKGADWALIESTIAGDAAGSHRLLAPAEYVPVVGEYTAFLYDASVNLPLRGGGFGMSQGAMDWFQTGPTTLAAINAEVDSALADIGLQFLLSAAVEGTDITDDSILACLVSSSATCDWDDFVNTTDSLQALRDWVGNGSNLTEAGGTGDHLTALATQASVDDIPTVSEFNARTLVAADYFDPAADAVANVTTVNGLAANTLTAAASAADFLAEINAEVDTALSDYDGPTRTEATADKDEILAGIAALTALGYPTNTAITNYPIWGFDSNDAPVTGVTDWDCDGTLEGGAKIDITDGETEVDATNFPGMYVIDNIQQAATNGKWMVLECEATGVVDWTALIEFRD